MMRHASFCLVALLLLINPAFGKKSANRNWQTGSVLDSQFSETLVGTRYRPGAVLSNGTRIIEPSTRAVYSTQNTVVIEGGNLIYSASEVLGRGEKPANLTVNGHVTFAVEDTTLYLIDENGKEHKMEIFKKALTSPAPPK